MSSEAKRPETTLTRTQLQELVKEIPYDEASIFTVEFVKRTTGELRVMTARRGVKKKQTGRPNSSGTLGLGYNAKSKNLLSVYDMVKKDYRMINCETIRKLKYKGITYHVIDAPEPTA
jgi:hypothetical protein